MTDNILDKPVLFAETEQEKRLILALRKLTPRQQQQMVEEARRLIQARQ